MKEGMSIVVPFLNEADGIEQFCIALDNYANEINFPLELIFVDDGSSDGSSEIIKGFKFKYIKKVKVIILSKNFGSHAAIRAGVLNSYYDICTWMGSDLQEPIEFLKMGYDKIIQEGYNTVYIEKNTVKVSAFNRFFSKLFAWLMRKYAIKNYASGGVSNIVFSNKIIELLNNNIETNSAINLQIMNSGFKSTTISLNYHERIFGKSKWTFSKKIKLLIDSFVSFSFMPIRMVSIIGILMFAFGLLFGIIIFMNKLINPIYSIPGYPTLACILAIGFGITNISLGIIAEYLWRTFDAARKRPAFIISEVSEIK